jgi:hypothetical protein
VSACEKNNLIFSVCSLAQVVYKPYIDIHRTAITSTENKGAEQMANNFYAVEIVTPEQGAVISRYFQTIRAARRWAAWTAKTWPTRILKGGRGGQVVA